MYFLSRDSYSVAAIFPTRRWSENNAAAFDGFHTEPNPFIQRSGLKSLAIKIWQSSLRATRDSAASVIIGGHFCDL